MIEEKVLPRCRASDVFSGVAPQASCSGMAGLGPLFYKLDPVGVAGTLSRLLFCQSARPSHLSRVSVQTPIIGAPPECMAVVGTGGGSHDF